MEGADRVEGHGHLSYNDSSVSCQLKARVTMHIDMAVGVMVNMGTPRLMLGTAGFCACLDKGRGLCDRPHVSDGTLKDTALIARHRVT